MISSRSMAAALASGALVGLTLLAQDSIPGGHGAIFFCFVPLWAVWINENSWRKIFFTGWLAQFVFTLIGFNWVAHTVHEFSHLSWPLSILVLLLYSAVANLYLPLSGLIWWKIFSQEKYSLPIRIAALVGLVALAEQFFPAIFPWNFGYVWFYQNWVGFQAADLLGFQGLSALTLVINGFVLQALYQFKNYRRRWGFSLLGGIAIFLLVQGLGAWRASLLEAPDQNLRVLVVQANIGNKLKHLADHGDQYREEITKKFMSLTAKGLAESGSRPDFALWPETSFPDFLQETVPAGGAATLLDSFLKKQNLNLVVGAYGETKSGQVTNAIFFLSARGGYLAPPYEKSQLLAWGEFIPGSGYFPSFKKWFPDVRDFGRGSGPAVANVAGHRIGTQICYEGIFSWFARDLALLGADVIVNVTNDSWYGDWQQPAQHLYLTLAKAVEVRRPIIRSTNTGYTAVALPSGKILEVSPIRKEWAHTYQVPYVAKPALTPFTRFGHWLVPAILAITLTIFFFLGGSRPSSIKLT